jgi:ubiquinol-cytochrome c reductase iron-sulfur subunit
MANSPADASAAGHAPQMGHDEGGTRRDFLYLAAGAVGAVGVASAVWPFISSLNPSADVLALSSTEVDVAPVKEGQAITVTWRGKPVFVRRRTGDEIKQAEGVPAADLPDPEADKARVKKPEWLVVVGVCTHLGCVPLGQKATDPRATTAAGSAPATARTTTPPAASGKGPAPKNLTVPGYEFLTDTKIRIG